MISSRTASSIAESRRRADRSIARGDNMHTIRRCRDAEKATILAIVNAAAEAYRDVIPADRWHDPYMSSAQLERDMAAGIEFWGYELDGSLIGVMGIQPVRDVDLIRHAYVRPGSQRHGVGEIGRAS